MGIAQLAIDSIWDKIGQIDSEFKFGTPAKNKPFRLSVTGHGQDSLTILTSENNPVTIRKQAFENALVYLLSHGHVNRESACSIAANKVRENAGPLSQSTHAQNEPMNITYVLPILKHMGLVGIEPAKPSSTWLVI